MEGGKRMPDIPGMYFDLEKNKYFKIEAGTAHSPDMVKRRRLNDWKADVAQTEKITREPYIRRSRTLQDSQLGGLLNRECGSRYASEDVIGGGLRGPQVVFSDTSVDIPMPAFAWDPVTRGLIVPRASHQMLAVCAENPSGIPLRFDNGSVTAQSKRLLYKSSNCLNLVYEDRKISSIHVNESARLSITTWMDINYFGIVVAYLQNEVAIPHTPDRMVSDGSHIHIRPPRGSPNQNITVWTSAPAPPSSALSFVVGMDNHLLTIEKERATTKWYTHSTRKRREVLSLDFLHSQHSVVLAGDRGGEISLVDLRLPHPELGEDTIRNPSSVTHIKSLDDHRIFVTGPGPEEANTMFQYDLRWRQKTRASGSRKKKDSFTIPILEYPDHQNTHPNFGVDVDIDAGLVAAAQEDTTVKLFSLHGGHEVNFTGKEYTWPYNVECIRFVPDCEDGTKSLYIAATHSISRYTW